MTKTSLGLLLALVEGLAQAPYQMPDAQYGQAYNFEIPVSNPNHIELVFTKTAGEIAPGLRLEENGLIDGTPTDAGLYGFTIAVLWHATELARHDYRLNVAPPKVQLLDPRASGINSASPQRALDPVSLANNRPLEPDQPLMAADGEQTRAVLGFQQSGASGANSDQKFFFDFYISRPLPWGDQGNENLDARMRWWGNVRVASAPRQISSPISTPAIGSSFKDLRVNELAESAEFLTGLDFRIGQICCALWSQSRISKERFVLSFIVGGGATGPLNAGTSAGSPVFRIDKSSPDFSRLVQMFPQAAIFPYISFIPPSRNQYFREYFGGFRLTTRYADRQGTPGSGPPAMISFTVGQNELVTGGHLRGVVDRVEAFFPLSTGRSDLLSAIYLFGSAQLLLNGAQNGQPFHLADASTLVNPLPAPGPANTVYAVTPSRRDIYSIGLGLDLLKILNSVNISVKTGGK